MSTYCIYCILYIYVVGNRRQRRQRYISSNCINPGGDARAKRIAYNLSPTRDTTCAVPMCCYRPLQLVRPHLARMDGEDRTGMT